MPRPGCKNAGRNQEELDGGNRDVILIAAKNLIWQPNQILRNAQDDNLTEWRLCLRDEFFAEHAAELGAEAMKDFLVDLADA